ncbi:MAG TPA: hypothetical protein VMP01_02110 [Pirellulaceae bacterium]|nr:hypothetical protein [Pirellulaceae bacterium]
MHRRLAEQQQAIDEIEQLVAVEKDGLAMLNDCGSYPQPDVSVTTRPRKWAGYDLSRIHSRYVAVTRLAVIGDEPVSLAAGKLDRLSRLTSLRLDAPSLTDSQLQPLPWLTELESLELRSETLNGSFLKQLPRETHLASLMLRSECLDDNTLASACRLRSLRSLSLMGLKLKSSATLSKLGKLPSVETLSLSGEFPISELRAIVDLPQLHTLRLSPGGESIDDEAFAQICRCGKVSDLQLLDLKLTRPERLRELARLRELFHLGLHGTFPNEGLETLALCDQLAFVTLESPSLNNDGVRRVARSPTIYDLTITSEQVDDGVLDDLAAMPSLRELTLWDTRTTAQGIARLRSKRPDVDVERYPGD